MKPTLEEVKAYFKNAKEVRCLFNDEILNITKQKPIGIHEFCGGFWLDIEGQKDDSIKLWSKNLGYAEIISYKDEPLTVSKEFILEAHNSACLTWKRKLEEQFPSVFVKDELEVGKCYKSNKADVIVFRNSDANNYGIVNSEWETNLFCSDVTEWIPATHQEVETALINEAKKRGFKEGVFIERVNKINLGTLKDGYKRNEVSDEEFSFSNNMLFIENLCIFKDGKWAEIIEQPTEMTVAEIEQKLGCKIKIVG